MRGLVGAGGPLSQAIDLHVGTGETVAVLGAPGTGKTVLVRTLSGLLPVEAGRVRFGDRDLTGADPVAIVQAGLIHVPQGGRLFMNLSVRDNLLLGATVRGRLPRQATLARVLELVPCLRTRLDRRPGVLDPAERRLLAIGRGLMALPRLLVLDAPVQALPPGTEAAVPTLLTRLQDRGLSILLVQQPGTPLPALANRVYTLEQGRLRDGDD